MEKNASLRYFAVFFTLVATTFTRLYAGENIYLDNPGFEEPFAPLTKSVNDVILNGEKAEAWGFNNMPKQAEIVCARETENVKEGASAQRLEIPFVQGGTVEFGQRVHLPPGRTYRFTIWVRADNLSRARLFVRQSQTPYKIFASETFEVSSEWTSHTVNAAVGKTGDVRMLLELGKPAIYWFDGAQVEEASDE